MKSLKLYLATLVAIVLMVSCNLDDNDTTTEAYDNWRQNNEQWLQEQHDLRDDAGHAVYTKVVPAWNRNAYVLMRWFNDTTLTRGNLRPLFTSTVDCKYIGRLYNDQPFDSSYTSTVPADSIYRTRLTDVIGGWTIAFERMHVGDSVEIIVPYQQAYGTSWSGKIPPYSMLRFNIKLTNVAGEYIRPNE